MTEAACPHSGRLRTRAAAPERTLARVCREARASVRFNAKLVDMNIAVPANDARAVEVLPLFHGAQLAAADITLWSALTATGMPRAGAQRDDQAYRRVFLNEAEQALGSDEVPEYESKVLKKSAAELNFLIDQSKKEDVLQFERIMVGSLGFRW